MGNVLGSNLFNLLVVAGLSAVISPLRMDKTLLRRDWPLSVLAAALLLVMMVYGGGISRLDGVLLLAVFAVIMAAQIRPALGGRAAQDGEETFEMSVPMVLVNIVLGLICIIAGGQLAVDGATGVARRLGLSETLIGLTIVAIGTSLPELVTSLVAARKGQNDIAMGNVIGSNLFNILLILGASSAISPISVRPTAIIDCFMLIAVSVLFYLPARIPGRRTADGGREHVLARPVGAAMVLCYAAYTVYLILR